MLRSYLNKFTQRYLEFYFENPLGVAVLTAQLVMFIPLSLWAVVFVFVHDIVPVPALPFAEGVLSYLIADFILTRHIEKKTLKEWEYRVFFVSSGTLSATLGWVYTSFIFR